jgi:hypothetical protein
MPAAAAAPSRKLVGSGMADPLYVSRNSLPTTVTPNVPPKPFWNPAVLMLKAEPSVPRDVSLVGAGSSDRLRLIGYRFHSQTKPSISDELSERTDHRLEFAINRRYGCCGSFPGWLGA